MKNKRSLYESIMRSVAKEVKRALNEDLSTLEDDEMFVDLGLPSGTLWAKYNLGVNPKKLNTMADIRGNSYAWGETEPKNKYALHTYDFYEEPRKISKYNNEDELTSLLPEDDAAYQTDRNMCIPSIEDAEELFKYTTSKLFYRQPAGPIDKEENAYLGKFFGMLLTSKINGKSIFIPTVPVFEGIERHDPDAYFWLSDLDSDNIKLAAIGYANGWPRKDVGGVVKFKERYYGLPIRPIIR